MSTEELWEGYQILGRHRNAQTKSEPAENWWERIWGKPKRPFRELRELRSDPWDQNSKGTQTPANLSETLLRKWSRRVRIQCLGVFDTVGSMGLDSLAIPWLRDHIAQFHNTRLTSLVMNGFQALAIDEHRANFVHIPWHQPIQPHAKSSPDSDVHVEQRWFVGAHSNIGGGYDDDVLAQYPLAWFVSECKTLGLVFKPNERDPEVLPSELRSLTQPEKNSCGLQSRPPQIRDSFSEFAHGFWKHFIRSKPEYRRIGPPPELHNGMLMQSANERLDPSVRIIKATAEKNRETYNPPNLWEFENRFGRPNPDDPPKHKYLDGVRAALFLLVWLAAISAAGWIFDRWLNGSRSHVLVFAFPLIALISDYIESALNHKVTLYPDGIKAEARIALMDFCLGLRLLAIVCFITGVFVLAANLFTWSLTSFRSPNMLWLLLLDLLTAGIVVSKTWSVAPMLEAGLGDLMPLQKQTTPESVRACLETWARGDFRPDSNALLMPVARTILRDIFSYIPAYSILLFIGSWINISLAAPLTFGDFHSHRIFGPFESDSRCWVPAAVIVIICLFAHVIKDSCLLNFVSRYPGLPSHSRVVISRAATLTRAISFVIGVATVISAAVRLSRFDAGSVVALSAGGAILLYSPIPVIRQIEEYSRVLYTQSVLRLRRGLNYLAMTPGRLHLR